MPIDANTLKAAEQHGRWLFAGDKSDAAIEDHVGQVCAVHETADRDTVHQLGNWLGEILRKRNSATMSEMKRMGIVG